jgi:hypothetical protein
MEKNGELLHEEILDKLNLLEEAIVHCTYERRYTIVDHLNVFNTLLCELTSMDVKIDEEDNTTMLLCLFPES